MNFFHTEEQFDRNEQFFLNTFFIHSNKKYNDFDDKYFKGFTQFNLYKQGILVIIKALNVNF